MTFGQRPLQAEVVLDGLLMAPRQRLCSSLTQSLCSTPETEIVYYNNPAHTITNQHKQNTMAAAIANCIKHHCCHHAHTPALPPIAIRPGRGTEHRDAHTPSSPLGCGIRPSHETNPPPYRVYSDSGRVVRPGACWPIYPTIIRGSAEASGWCWQWCFPWTE